MSQRRVSFASASIIVEWSDPRERSLVDFLFCDTESDDSVPPHVRLRLERDDTRVRLLHNKTQLFETSCMGTLASMLVGQTIHHLCDRLTGGIALHAAAVSREGLGLLLPGRSGAGKTTLTGWLSSNGFTYLTDELIFIGRDSTQLKAFPRPLCLKEGGWLALRKVAGIDYSSEQALTSPGLTMLSRRLFNAAGQQQTPQVKLILFPHFQSGSELELLRLSKAQAGLALMESLVNARNLDDHGFGDATRLARTTPAYRLTYGSFAQLPQVIRRLGF